MKIFRLVFISFFIVQSSFGQTWQDTLALINKAFSHYHPQDPGCQVSVSRNDQQIFSKAWGMADLERKAPLTAYSVLEAGSVSKQFTAAAILLLEQQGKLSLDDDVRKYVPELPGYGDPIRLRQMLHHTSGLRDWGVIAALTGWPRSKKFYTNEDALEIIARQKHLNNRPGDEFLYSNSNYNLFAIIVQRVSGLSLAEFTRQYIFVPAGMTHTQWRDDPNRLVPHRAIAYLKKGDSYQTDMPNEYVYGNGGLLTTTEDLLKWSNFYQQGKLGGPSLLSKQMLVEPLNNGEINRYAAGLFIRQVMGWNNINHVGATASYRAFLETFPELHLSIAILSNTSEFDIMEIAGSIRKIFVTDRTEKKKKSDAGMDLPVDKLNNLAGLYKNERDGSTFQLSVKNKTLVLDNEMPLITVSGNIFRSDDFLFDIRGTTGSYIPFLPRDTIPFVKVTPVTPSPGDLAVYEGKYFSEEVGSVITIEQKDGKLIVRLKANDTYPLIPTYADAFKIPGLDGDLQFTRSPEKRVVMMKISVPRARNVEFKKSE
ncbi:MAG: beta-lactamase family protein [Chitinophagaceae bacterium]|nr:beta-lactamase family protein [Chitinophagaceae bacterium]